MISRGRSNQTASFSRLSCGESGDRFHIIAGERRWRAAQKAGLHRVPVVVREIVAGQERSLLEMALIENIQRENLNPIDEAHAYRRLTDDFDLTQDDIAAAVGKDRATVANFLRLLKLPEDVRADVATGNLSMGHARALLALAERRRSAAPGARRHRPKPVRPRDRVARSESRRSPTAGRQPKNKRNRSTFTRAQPKIGSSSYSAPGFESSGRAKRDESKSISPRKPN